MSIRLVSVALVKTFRGIAKRQPSASTLKLVAISLLDHANDEGLSIHPSIAKTAARTDTTRRTVSNVLAFFRRQGFFEPVGVVGHKKQVIDYQCNVERLLALPDAPIEPAAARTSERDSQVNEIHGYVGTTFTGTSESDSQLTVRENRQYESSGTPARKSARAGQPKKPRVVLTPEEQLAESELSDALRKASKIVGSQGLVNRVARDLRLEGYDAGDVLGLYVGERSAWRRFDFRGKKNELPTVTLIKYTIGSLAHQAASANGSSEQPLTRQQKILQRAREKSRAAEERMSDNGA
jgi:hypothetical protein